jgi:hydrogenase expression/formation protein HypE
MELTPQVVVTREGLDALFGQLAARGYRVIGPTVRDAAIVFDDIAGVRPLYMSAGFILEEGLGLALLQQIVASMRAAAAAAGIRVVTGDTKVVDRGKADGLFITSSGVGAIVAPAAVEPQAVCPGDAVIISGDVGRHGIAVMAARDALGIESSIESDCAPLAEPVVALIAAGIAVHCLRDLTRGGLTSALVEIAETGRPAIAIDEQRVPVREDVRAACELLGLDPLHIANEGRFVAFVPAAHAEWSVAILHRHDVARDARAIGSVSAAPAGRVTAKGPLGATRVIDMLSGEQLPRIC